jgi:hypothetical protein
MPDISEYYKGGSNNLEAKDVDEDKEYIVTAWREKVWDDGTKSYYLKLKGEDREFRVNKPNAKRIARMYGPDIDDWVGKGLRLLPDVIDSGTHQGKPTIVVRVRNPKVNDRNPPPARDDDYVDRDKNSDIPF